MYEPFCYLVDEEERCDSEEARRLLRTVATLDDRGARLVLVVTGRYVAVLARARGRTGVVVVGRGDNLGLALLWLESKLGASIVPT